MSKFYITTSIAYTNAPPHIGFALEAIQADVFARYHRILGDDVFFLTGTDEHGIKNVKSARKAGKTTKEFTREISDKFKKLTNVLNISNDYFIRTSDKEKHWPSVEKVWKKLEKNRDIYKKKYKGLYCVGCEAFITKKDLVNGKCQNHKKEPEKIEEENYFFRLSKYSKEIKKALEKNEIEIIPSSRKNEMLTLINEGLEDVSFSRPRKSLSWGVPVPSDKNQVIYVWSDALVNYISALGYVNNTECFKKYWPADVHCIGKDILRFHSLTWPAMLMSLNICLPKKIFVHGFITSNGQKMSKSLGNTIDPFELVKKYGVDAVRYFFLREISPTEDGDFSYEKFEERYNSDLASGLGNLVSRVIAMANKFDVKSYKTENINKFIIENCDIFLKKYKMYLNNFKPREALVTVWNFIHFCDLYIDKEKPWEKGRKEVINNLLFAIENIAKMLKPFLPETSIKILENIKKEEKEILFPRI